MKRFGTNTDTMQAANRSIVLQMLAQKGKCTRSELAEETGLTQASISKIISEMIESGVVSEGALSTGKKGRRAIEIYLNEDICRVIGVKLTRSSFSAAVFNLGGKSLDSVIVPVAEGTALPENIVSRIKHEIRELIHRYDGVRAIGIAVPGPYLRNQGRIALMSRFSGWSDIDIRHEFESEFDIPVIVEHDTNASSYAEYVYGSTGKFREHGTLVSLIVGEGIGAGIVEDGMILYGSNGVAGEVGHMSVNMDGPRCSCGNRGCLELYCSSLAFAANVERDLPRHPESSLQIEKEITAETVFKHMRMGDTYAAEKVREAGRYIGCGLANIVYLYNPNKIIITDAMTGGGETLLEAAREALKERVLPELYDNLRVRFTRFSDDTVLMGAGALAAKELLKDPRSLYPSGSSARD